jgi:1,5-anhydro-D-fructose reductase (1,5-anhydro-D-mannitol-forming)
MRWGLLGTGLHARSRIAPALAACAHDSLYGVAGSTPAKAAAFSAEFPGCVAYDSLAAMLADPAIEAVFISTPNDQHRAQAEQIAAAGRHVLVEKPMALEEADCRAMIEACGRAGVRLGVGFQQRLHPVHREIRRLIEAGELGEVVLLRAEWHTAYPPWTNWRASAARAGSDVLAAVGVHALDLLCWFGGAEVGEIAGIVDISAVSGLDQTLAATLRFANGAIGLISMTRRARAPKNGIWVWGSAGMVGAPSSLGMAPTGVLVRGSGAEQRESALPMPDLYAAQFEAFAAPDGVPAYATGEDGLRSVALSRRLLAECQRTEG